MIDRCAFVLLAILVFTLPWEKSVVVPGLGTLTRIVGVLTALSGAVAVSRSGLRRTNALLWVAAAFVLWSAITWFWSYDPAATVARVTTYVQLIVFLLLIWNLSRTAARDRTLMIAYVAGAAIASGATILRYSQGLQTYYRRYAAPGFDPNDLGVTVALSIPMALYLGLRSSGRVAWLYAAAVALSCSAILLTASRTALIASYVAFGFVLVTWRGSSAVQRATGLGLAAMLTLGAFALAPKESRQRIATTTTEITQGTLHDRTQIWKAGLRALRQRPVRGAGAGAYPDAVEPFIGVPGRAGHEYVAHNVFLSVLVETGLVGFILYAGLLLLVILYIWVLPPPARALWATVLIVWVLGASTLTWEHRKPTWLMFGLVSTAWARAFRDESGRLA